jgi:hypothetical protein
MAAPWGWRGKRRAYLERDPAFSTHNIVYDIIGSDLSRWKDGRKLAIGSRAI